MTPTRACLRILVADDDADTVLSWSALFKLWGHECITALDGVTALATAAAFRPDVILLDLGLPRLDGFEVMRQLRQRPEAAGVLVWIVTGFVQEASRMRAREAGADLFLLKPVDPEYLSGLLSQLAAKVRQAGQAHIVGLNGSQPNGQRSTPPFHRNLGTSEPATS